MVETPVAGAEFNASCYRVKFNKKEFLELVDMAKPRIIYRRKNVNFFDLD